jgi:hypothetical protein
VPQKQSAKRNNQPAETLLADVVRCAERPDTPRQEFIDLLCQLLDLGPLLTFGVKAAIKASSDEERADLQQEIRTVVRQVVTARANGGMLASIPINVALTPVPSPTAKHPGRVLLGIAGEPRDVVWFQLLRLLQTVGLNRVLVCECGKTFVKVGRREFCSVNCQKRVYMRQQRAEERQDRARRERRSHGKATRTR